MVKTANGRNGELSKKTYKWAMGFCYGMRYRACLLVFSSIFVAVTLYIYCTREAKMTVSSYEAYASNRKHQRLPVNQLPRKQRTILMWLVPFHDLGMVVENVFSDPLPTDTYNLILKSTQCGNCRITYDRTVISDADAVVFHGLYPNETDFNHTDVPRKGHDKQVFVWWSQESNANRLYDSRLRNYFDCTMGPSANADIFSPYASFPWILKMLRAKGKPSDIMLKIANIKGEFLEDPEETASLISQYIDSRNKATKFEGRSDGNVTKLVKRKRRLAAWIVSNCHTEGGLIRSNLAYEIMDAGLNFDQFGNCANEPFPVQSRWDPAFFEILSIYKFYFSFENSVHCRNYMTEKLWYNAMYSGAVPVIWGPHKLDVASALPPKSYIHVEDFKSVKDLVDYLHYLDKNTTAYGEYLEWRTWTKYLNKDGEYSSRNLKRLPISERPSPKVKALLEKYAKMKPIGFCRLCRMIHASQPIRCESAFDERDECLNTAEAENIAEQLYLSHVQERHRDLETILLNS